MPHINHRRGDTRRRSKHISLGPLSRCGHWNRMASRQLRAMAQQRLEKMKSRGYVDAEEVVFPHRNEAETSWDYD